ncbi:MAG TPA: ABC transporter permease [Planctomycetes bacterium]|nr:ABC transporter permease [Planctomycetota bacterium]
MTATNRGKSPTQMAFRRLRRNVLAMAGAVVVLIVVLLAFFPSMLVPSHADGSGPYGFAEQFRDKDQYQQPPLIPGHPLGTDELGRDVLTRIIYGAGISLRVGLIGTIVAVLIGLILGSVAGFRGGLVDTLISRLTDTFFAFPSLLLMIGILAVFEKPNEFVIFSALGVVGWPGVARIVRGQVISLRGSEFVLGARALGQSDTRILIGHVLPNCLGPVVVVSTLMIAGNILAEAGLSFLGIGLPPPAPSWGRMLVDSKEYWVTMPWMGIFPGLAIMFTVLGFNLLGDGLRDAFDPKMKD